VTARQWRQRDSVGHAEVVLAVGAGVLHSVYDQPDAVSVHAQLDRILDAAGEKLPAAAAHLDTARADVLAFTTFAKELWRQIWSNNPQERLNRGDPPPDRRGRDLPHP
jgi:transposase-like protein